MGPIRDGERVGLALRNAAPHYEGSSYRFNARLTSVDAAIVAIACAARGRLPSRSAIVIALDHCLAR